MHVDVGPKNNCLNRLQLSHPVWCPPLLVWLEKLLGLVVHIAQTPVVCQERRLTYMTTWYGPCRDWTQSFASHGLCQPPFQHALGESTSATTQMEGFMWSSYMYMALQMYVIGDVTVVVWHLYLFGYVLVVYVCVIVINVESSRRYYMY